MSATKERLKRHLKRLLKLPADALIARSVYLSDGFEPYRPDQRSYVLRNPSGQGQERARSQLPTPPQDLWMGRGGTIDQFLLSGEIHVATMKRILESSGFYIKGGNRILDFGCAAGRMIRWFDDVAEACEIWGVDISASHIIWCQQHLSPPFNFSTVTTAPHLPFEDGYFDLIYAGSVFTHIADLADAWFLELKRIARPGGRLYITVKDNHTIDLIINHPEKIYDGYWTVGGSHRDLLLSYYKKENISQLDFDMFTINRGRLPSYDFAEVFHDINYLRRHWGRFMKILSVTQEARNYQTAIVFEK